MADDDEQWVPDVLREPESWTLSFAFLAMATILFVGGCVTEWMPGRAFAFWGSGFMLSEALYKFQLWCQRRIRELTSDAGTTGE